MKNLNYNTKNIAYEYDLGLRSYMIKVYNYMFLALLLTGLSAYITITFPTITHIIYIVQNGVIKGFSSIGLVLLISPIFISLFLSFNLPKIPVFQAHILFWLYACLLGISLSSIFIIYTKENIAYIFFITASIFGIMSLYGYTTKRDLLSLNTFLFMGIIGLVIASLINLFLKSNLLQFALSIISIFIFTALTAYDAQRIKSTYDFYYAQDKNTSNKIAIIGALNLYLDFINIFIHLLQLFGKKKE